MTSSASPTFEPPGPGRWERDSSHSSASPSRVLRRVSSTAMAAAYREVFAEFGAPLHTMDVQFVHGAMYRRLVPLVGANSDRPPPPKPVMWLALRLHPQFRARERAAKALWTNRPDRAEVENWYRTERQEWIAKNLAVQSVDVTALSDTELAGQLRSADAHLLAGWHRHHVLHGADTGPIGDLLVSTSGWGLDPAETMMLLRGHSPSTSSSATHARGIVEALNAAGIDPAAVRDLQQVREVPAAATLLDEYLLEVAWQVCTSYDIEALTVGELPAATCALIRAQAVARPEQDLAAIAAAEDRLRSQVPADDRAEFDELLGYARRAYGMRDDNGPLTAEWPMGLLRRAFLEAGHRLGASGRLPSPTHVFELDTEELAAVLEGAASPTAADAESRVAERMWESSLIPPDVLGPEMPEPELSIFPGNTRRTMEVVITATSLLDVDPTVDREHLCGLGIGDRTHKGVARMADNVEELMDIMEPGDVLVAPWTAPTFNALFSIAGAVVVREGGLLCHAAVMARELSIPSVIGCRDAMTEIRNGDLVEVDPVAGRVRVLTPAVSES